MKLYFLYLVKGKQLFKVGDNIKDHLEYAEDFKEKKLLDWGTNFQQEIEDMNIVVKRKNGHWRDWDGKYEKPVSEKEIINQCIVFCSASGKIHGIMEINKNNREELKKYERKIFV